MIIEYSIEKIEKIKNSYANKLNFKKYKDLLDYVLKLDKKKLQYKILSELINILESNIDDFDELDNIITEYNEFILEMDKNYEFNLLIFE